jgi:hypothetical protein
VIKVELRGHPQGHIKEPMSTTQPQRNAGIMSRTVAIPLGAWPLEMRAETAAAYCDEPSVEAFLAKVAKGIYPPPMRCKGALPKWHRLKLNETIARRHGLLERPEIEDATALIG